MTNSRLSEKEMKAITKATKKYADEQIREGKKIKKEWKNVLVVKTWFTNNDNDVCPQCKSFEGRTIELDEYFDNENKVFSPPAHEGCRCWIGTNTKI